MQLCIFFIICILFILVIHIHGARPILSSALENSTTSNYPFLFVSVISPSFLLPLPLLPLLISSTTPHPHRSLTQCCTDRAAAFKLIYWYWQGICSDAGVIGRRRAGDHVTFPLAPLWSYGKGQAAGFKLTPRPENSYWSQFGSPRRVGTLEGHSDNLIKSVLYCIQFLHFYI